jgi:histidinol-phosphate aminotransferase
MLLRREVLDLQAYHVSNSCGCVKLDAMENPYLLPRELQDEIARAVAAAPINRYPDSGAHALKEKIRDLAGLPRGVDVLLGNGSDELIQLLAMAVNKPGAVLLGVEPSFVMYRLIASYTGLRYAAVPLAADFSLDLDAVLRALKHERPALTFLSFPNNPTGNLFSADAIRRIIRESPGLVVLDEAYYAFATDSFISCLQDYANLLVLRTFSKLGMAGLRLGFLAGKKEWLEHLEKLRLPYNIGTLPQIVAGKLLQHHQVLLQQAGQIKLDRAKLLQRMGDITAVKVYDSEANFLLFKVADANAVFKGLKDRGILIKNLNGAHPLLEGCLRVTVGTPEENEKFISALQEAVFQTA